MSSHIVMICPAPIGTAIVGTRVFTRADGIITNRLTSFHLKPQ